MELIDRIKRILIIIVPLWIVIIAFLLIHQRLSINLFTSSKHQSSSYLKNLTIEGHPIDFDPNQDYYEISVTNEETSLAIKAETEDRSATVKIFNNDDLTNHNAVYIYVTSKDHDIRKYTISYNNKTAMHYFNENIDGCNNIESDYCIKYFDTKDKAKTNYLMFTYDYLVADGYPHNNIININDVVFFNKTLVNAEFRNFNILDNNIVFTYNNSKEKNKITIMSVNTDGKIIMNYPIINNKYKNLYTYSFQMEKNKINVKTRLVTLDKASICKLNNQELVEARYTIKYMNSKFIEPILDNKLTVLEYKILMNIKCD